MIGNERLSVVPTEEAPGSVGNREVENPKHPPPFSPAMKRMLKRHTSATNPPFSTPTSRLQFQANAREPSLLPKPENSILGGNVPSNTVDDPFRGEETLVGDLNWDEVLPELPPPSLEKLSFPGGCLSNPNKYQGQFSLNTPTSPATPDVVMDFSMEKTQLLSSPSPKATGIS